MTGPDDQLVADVLAYVEEGLRRMLEGSNGITVEGFLAGDIAFIVTRAEAVAVSPVPPGIRTELGGSN